MSGFNKLMKGGWHPEGKGSSGSGSGGSKKESWRGDFKGVNTVANWMGKGKDSAAEEARQHQSTPLSALKDPASFAPPPKRYGNAVPPPRSGVTPPPRPGSSAPPSRDENRLPPGERERRHQQPEQSEDEAEKPPPGPYRVNTTGLRTDHLPPPPVRRLNSPATTPHAAPSPSSVPQPKSKPALPPRLPPRQNSNPDAYAPPPPPTYTEATRPPPPQQPSPADGYLNQRSLHNLTNAGLSVPGLNIGRTASPPVPPRTNSPAHSITPPQPPPQNPHLTSLHSRFSHLSTNDTEAPSTSWAQKHAALQTAATLRANPSAVSVADARAAATTANSFRARHGAQIASGLQVAGDVNQRYGDGGAAAAAAALSPPASPSLATGASSSSSSPRPGAIAGKKPAPPPPPPKKKMSLLGQGEEGPPPVPLASKPPVPLASKPRPPA